MCIIVGTVDPRNDGNRGSITSGCRHHKSHFYAPRDPKTQARSIDVRPGFRHGRGIDYYWARVIGSVAVSLEGHVPAGRGYAGWSPKYSFEREYLERSFHVFSIYRGASLCCKWHCTDISNKFGRIKSWSWLAYFSLCRKEDLFMEY